MAKNQLKNDLKKCFEFDLKSILSSDSSNGEDNDADKIPGDAKVKRRKISSTVEKGDRYFNKKIERVHNENGQRSNKENRDISKISKLIGNLENDFNGSINKEKDLLQTFTESVVDLHQVRYTELILKQDAEVERVKNKFVNEVTTEIHNWQKYINQIKEEEEKIIKKIEQLRTVYNSSEIQKQKIRKISEIHKDFIQKYEEMMKKHKSESAALKTDINKEICDFKKAFLSDMKKMGKRRLSKTGDSIFNKSMNF